MGSGQGSAATRAILGELPELPELPELAAEPARGTFSVEGRAVSLSDVERAWVQAAASGDRLVITP